IWVVEYDELYRIDPHDFTKTHISAFSKAAGKQLIYCLYSSSRGHLWAGTQSGLIQYIPDENKARFFPLRTASDVGINSIMEDHEGNIWSSSNTSLQKINPDNKATEIFPLDKNIPLKSFFYGCAAKTSHDEIIFGGDNGYIIFSPERVKPNLYHPEVFITAFEINNRTINIHEDIAGTVLLEKDIAFTHEMTLNFDQRSVAFEFSSLHFWQPTMNKIGRASCRDRAWIVDGRVAL